MSLSHHIPSLFLEDDLYCSEEQWEDVEVDQDDVTGEDVGCPPLILFELPQHELSLSDVELKNLFIKEEQIHQMFKNIENDSALVESRHGAVEWILKVRSFYSFSPLTAVLAVNYLDRFIFLSLQHSFQKEKPWMSQLAAVACLSLAAKVEEIHVPLLLDLQVEETKYVFEAKTIQKMEILILSTLEWKMTPVNPLTFLEHFCNKLGWSSPIYEEFIQRCHLVVLLALYDCRNMSRLASVMAATTMLHVLRNVHPDIAYQFENRLLSTLGINKEKVSECNEFIRVLASHGEGIRSMKRKFESMPDSPRTPTCVMDASFSSDSSSSECSTTSAGTSSPEPHSKRGRVDHRPHGYLHCTLDEASPSSASHQST